MVNDYEKQVSHDILSGIKTSITLIKSDVLQFFLADGTKISVRPSGTEPKIKFYIEVRGEMKSRSEYDAADAAANKKIEAAKRAKEWELARLLVRLFRSLDALWGHEDTARTWLASGNLALAARPRDLLRSVEGMVRVVAYLDAARGRL